VARTKEIFGAGPDNLLGYALAGSAAWGVASLAESPIDFYKSQMQKQLIQARLVRARAERATRRAVAAHAPRCRHGATRPAAQRNWRLTRTHAPARAPACAHCSALRARAPPACTRQTPGSAPRFTGMVDCVKQSVAANGIVRGPLQGFSATLARNLPAAGVYFGTFEALKARATLVCERATAPLRHCASTDKSVCMHVSIHFCR
jgi:hypothetical protein